MRAKGFLALMLAMVLALGMTSTVFATVETSYRVINGNPPELEVTATGTGAVLVQGDENGKWTKSAWRVM